MKTIEQLLKLKKNPYYKLNKDEQAVLEDFLLRSLEEPVTPKKSSTDSSKKTRAIVRNVVKKTNTEIEELDV